MSNKIIVTLSIFFFCQNVIAQKNLCVPIAITSDTKLTNFDSLSFSFKNIGKEKLSYSLEVMVFNSNKWLYSDLFTMYFNREISFEKLYNLYYKNNKIIFSPNYSVMVNELEVNDVVNISFKISEQVRYKTLLRFRIHILDGKDNCDIIISKPFYFTKIK